VHELANAALKMMFSGDASQWYRAMQMPHYNTRSMPAISLHTGMHLIQARPQPSHGSARAPGPDPCMLQTRKPLWSFTHWLVRAAPPAARLACVRVRRALRGRAPHSGRSARRACARARSGRSPAGSSCTTTAAVPPTARTTARPRRWTSQATTACSTSRSTSWPARPAPPLAPPAAELLDLFHDGRSWLHILSRYLQFHRPEYASLPAISPSRKRCAPDSRKGDQATRTRVHVFVAHCRCLSCVMHVLAVSMALN